MAAEVNLRVVDGAPSFLGNYADVLNRCHEVRTVAREVENCIAQIDDMITERGLPGVAGAALRNALMVTGRAASLTFQAHGLVHAAAGLEASAIFLQSCVGARRAMEVARTHLMGTVEGAIAIPALYSLFSGLPAPDRPNPWSGDTDAPPAIPGTVPARENASLYDDAWICDGVVPQEFCLLRSLSEVLVATPLGLLPPEGLCQWSESDDGLPLPHQTLEHISADMLALGHLFGIFRRSASADAPDAKAAPRPTTTAAASDRTQAVPPGVRPPTSCAGLLRDIASLAHLPTHIRLFGLGRPDGTRRWVAEFSGSQFRSVPQGGKDRTGFGGLEFMAGGCAELTGRIRRALQHAGIAEGDPVLVAGHCQAGLMAACLARDAPDLNVTHVITAGAPSAWVDLPRYVTLLSLEHPQDQVVRLVDPPLAPQTNRVRVTDNLFGTGLRATGTAGKPLDDTGIPDCTLYVRTAQVVDRSTDPRLTMLRAELSGFFSAGTSEVTCQDIDLGTLVCDTW